MNSGVDVEIVLPQGCACRPGVEIGGYQNQVELETPAHMLALGSVGWLEFRRTTCVDRCVAALVQELWRLGVVTTGACCGHNQLPGYIGIWQAAAAHRECNALEQSNG